MRKWSFAVLFLAVFLALLCVSSGAFAATSGSCGDNVTYVLDGNGVLTISGTGDMRDYNLTYTNGTYKTSAPWGTRATSIVSVVIEDGVTSIGKYAFYGCSNLASVTIADSVTSIGSYAFRDCSIMASVTIPNSVTSIASGTFQYCHSLTSVTIPGSVTSIGNDAFKECRNLTSVTIPSSVTSIGNDAFRYSSNIEEIHIDSIESWLSINFQNSGSHPNYTSSSVHLFIGNTELKNVIIPESVTSIGEYAFYNCSSLTSVTIPGSVTSIGDEAFDGCSGLTEIYYDGVVSQWCDIEIGSGNTNLTPIHFSDGSCYRYFGKDGNIYWKLDDNGLLTISGTGAMSNYSDTYTNGTWITTAPWGASVTSIVIEDGVTSIGNYAFDGCSSLTSVTIPDSVTSIGYDAFEGCSSLTSVTIPDSVTSIGEDAFLGCSGLTSVTIPDSVTSIGGYAFESCSSLTSVTIPDSVTSIGNRAFENCSSLMSVTIPDSVTSIGEGSFACCSSLASIQVNSGNIYYTSVDGVLFTKDKSVLIICPGGKIGTYTIPDGVTSIGFEAFSNCSSLTSVTIPDSVTSIGELAFLDCSSLTSVTIPGSVTSIGDYAFEGCSGLTEIYYDGVLSQWCDITIESWHSDLPPIHFSDGSCYRYFRDGNISGTLDDKGVLTISGTGAMSNYSDTYTNGTWITTAPWGANVTRVVIEDGVTSIGDYAFRGCSNLTSVTIPNSVTSIGKDAFSGCSNIEEIHIDSIESWLSINFQNFDSRPNCASSSVHLFIDKTELKNVVIPASVTSIRYCAFESCSGLTSVMIPSSVTSIGSSAFRDCSSLTSVTIPDSVTSIGGSAFYGCNSLTSVTIPASVTSIGGYVFSGCSSLTSVTIPDSVTSIGGVAFYGCRSLTSVTIPASVTSIGNNAFSSCNNLIKCAILGDTVNFGTNIFSSRPTIYCYEYTDVDFWAADQGYPIVYLDAVQVDDIRTVALEPDFSISSGESKRLSIDIFPNDQPEVTWVSSDPAILSVENGVVTALSSGTATVTATVGTISASVTIEVYAAAATGFTLSESECWVISKKSFQLSVLAYEQAGDSAGMIWSSADTNFATVDSTGLVTTKKPGDVVITATTERGVSRQCLIHICYPVTAIAFADEALTILQGDTAQLTANVTMRTQSCVNHLVTFSSSDETVATVSETGVVTAHALGTATVTATAASGVSAECAVTVRGANILTLPASTTTIESEAFANLPAVDRIVIPATVTSISDDAFSGSNITIVAPADSYAANWAEDHGVICINP